MRNSLADICKDDEYNNTEFKSSDDVLWCTNGRILIWWPLVRATMHASVSAAPWKFENKIFINSSPTTLKNDESSFLWLVEKYVTIFLFSEQR